MLTGIDHVILAAPDPEAAAAEFESALGLRVAGGGRHEAHGTYNRVLWLGDTYVELMGVFGETLAANSWWGAHMLARLAAGGGYAGLALASDDLDADVARLRALGSTIADSVAGERLRPDGEVVRWAIGRLPAPHPELGLTFLIEHDVTAAEWRPADRSERARLAHPLGGPATLVRVELPVAEIARASMYLLRALGLQFRPSLAGGGARDSTIGTQGLRLSRGTELPVISIRAGTEPRTYDLVGCRVNLGPR